MSTLSLIFKFSFLILVMLFVGLSVTREGVVAFAKDRGYVIRLILANLVIIPIVGIGLAYVLPVPPEFRPGIIFLACFPGGFNAIQFTTKFKGQAATAAGATFLLTLTGLILIPVVALILGTVEHVQDLPLGPVLTWLLTGCVAPILAGVLIRRRLPAVACILAPAMNGLSTLCFIGAVLTTMAIKKSILPQLGGATIAALFLLLLAGFIVGWLMGGPDKPKRRIAAVVTNNRNAPLGLLIALSGPRNNNLDLVALAFLLFVIPLNLGFTIYNSIKAKKE